MNTIETPIPGSTEETQNGWITRFDKPVTVRSGETIIYETTIGPEGVSEQFYTSEPLGPSLYEQLVIALDSFFEYDTHVRFDRLMSALEASLAELGLEPSDWGAGYRLQEEYRQQARRL